MSQAAAHAAAFYREVARSGRLWTVRDQGGFPAPKGLRGRRAQPFWSSLSRVQKVIRTVDAYSQFEPYEIQWADFRSRWLPGLTKDGVLIGLNWSGADASGFDLQPDEVARAVEMEQRHLDASA